jgi:hypothetical protein
VAAGIVGRGWVDDSEPWPGTPFPTNKWIHVALVKSLYGYSVYIDGDAKHFSNIAYERGSFDYQPLRAVTIGALGSQGESPFRGRISNARIVKGQALYTSNFNPYIAAAPPFKAVTATGVTTPLLTLHSSPLTNSGSGGTLTVSGTVSAVSPTTNSSPSLTVIDTGAQRVLANIPITSGSWGVASRSSVSEVYVSNILTGSVQVISTSTDSVEATIATGLTEARNLIFDSSGDLCYVNNCGAGASGKVAVINAVSRSLLTTIAVPENPTDMLSIGSAIFVLQQDGSSIVRISTNTNTITGTYESPGHLPGIDCIAYDATSATIYAILGGGFGAVVGKILKINPTTLIGTVSEVSISSEIYLPQSLQVSMDGSELYFSASIYNAEGTPIWGIYAVNIATGVLSPRFIPEIVGKPNTRTGAGYTDTSGKASLLVVSPPNNSTTYTSRNSLGWHHFALTKAGTTWRAFVDGVQRHTWTSSINLFPVGDWKIGTNSAGLNFNGLVDDFRLTDAVEYARTSTGLLTTITPPAAELPPTLTPFTTAGTQEIYANAGDYFSYEPTLFTETPLEFSYFVVPVKIVVSGAGVSAVNGTYIRDGDFNEKPTYTKQGGVGNIGVYGEGANKVWAIATNNLKDPADVSYRSNQTNLVSPAQATWVAASGVSGSIPTVQAVQTADFSNLTVDRYAGGIAGKINTSVPHLRGYNASLGQTWADVPADPSLGYPTLELYYYWYMSSQDYSANSPAGFTKINIYVRVSYNLTQGPALPYTHQITSSQDLLHLPTAKKVLINAKGYFYLYDIESNGIKRCFYSAFGRRGTVAQDLAIEEELVTPGDFLNSFRKYSWAADSERVYLSVKSSGVSPTEAYTVYSASIANLAAANAFTAAPPGFTAWNLVTEPSTNMVYFRSSLGGGAVKTYKFTSGWSYVEI